MAGVGQQAIELITNAVVSSKTKKGGEDAGGNHHPRYPGVGLTVVAVSGTHDCNLYVNTHMSQVVARK